MTYGRRSFIKILSQASIASGMLSLSTFNKSIREDKPINPWIELSKEAYLKNASEISKMAQGKPVLAVLKNNAYGLGDVEVGQILDTSPHISGIALVKEERALALRSAGIKKPLLLMADFNDGRGTELIESGISLAVHSYDALKKIQQASKGTNSIAKVEIYVDTGLGRMGMPYYMVRDLVRKVAEDKKLQIVGIFTTLTTPKDFANEQLDRFAKVIKDLKEDGIETGIQHAAPSSSLLDIPAAHLDQVRPGILLHGSFPLVNSSASKSYTLHPTFKLKARVIRVEKLRKGDSVGFSRFYTAPKDEWIATIPIGWADGYDSGSENGAKVLVGDHLYPVINVNASHCNLLLNSKDDIRVGEVATMIGPDLPEITPEGFAKSIKGHNYLQIKYKQSIPKYVLENFE